MAVCDIEFEKADQLESTIKNYEGIIWHTISALKRGFRAKTGRLLENGVEEIEFVGGFEPTETEREDLYAVGCEAVWEVWKNPSIDFWASRKRTIRLAMAEGKYTPSDLLKKVYVKHIYSAVRREAYQMKKTTSHETKKSYDDALKARQYKQALSLEFISASQVLERNKDTEAMAVARLLMANETMNEIQKRLGICRISLGQALVRIERAMGVEA